MLIRTERGSTYLVGPSQDGRRVRVARVSDHPVRGIAGACTFVSEFERVGLVPDPGGLRLECTTPDGQRLRTSLVIAIDDHEHGLAATA